MEFLHRRPFRDTIAWYEIGQTRKEYVMARTVSEQMAEINALHKRHETIYRSYATKLGLPEMSFWVMYAICSYRRPITQYELCKDWGYSKQTVNSAVLNLVKDGYITSTETGEARKKKMLELSEMGERYCEETVYPMLLAERASLNHLSMEERDFFIEVYGKQLEFLQRAIAPVMDK